MREISSSSWTGMDPFADLSAEEREGSLVIGGSRKRLARALIVTVCAGLLGLGAAAYAALFALPVLLGGSSPGGHGLTALSGAVVSAAAMIVARWLYARLGSAHKSAPLALDGSTISFGSPARTIRIDEISGLSAAGARSVTDLLAEVLYLSAFWPLRSATHRNRLQLTLRSGEAAPVLDLDVLDGMPSRIEAILSCRIAAAHARAAPASPK
jgi:hypothetical protein